MKKIYTIGRDRQNDIVIEDESDVISRLHATIRFDGCKMYLIDQSQNGTYVNGMRMASNEEIPVSRKNTITFANVAELDWNQLPDPSKARKKKIWITLLSLLALPLIIWAVLHFTKKQESVTPEETSTETTTDNNVNHDSSDDVIDKDSVTSNPQPTEDSNIISGSTKTGGKSKKTKEEDKEESEEKKENNTTTPNEEKEESKTDGDIPLY